MVSQTVNCDPLEGKCDLVLRGGGDIQFSRNIDCKATYIPAITVQSDGSL
jgi:hypothetical protein